MQIFLFQKLMSYPLVQKLLSPSNDGVTKILDTEKLVGNVLWKDIVGGAELIFNIIDCIETTVQGFKDEKSLEKEARKLLKENRFLAGKVIQKIVGRGSIAWIHGLALFWSCRGV